MTVEEREYLEARIRDAARQCEERSVPKFVGFLDPAGAAIALKVAAETKADYKLFGGYDTAERVFVGFLPPWCDKDAAKFPIVKLRIHNKSDRVLSHRDILGAIMSAGVERDTVGDILPDKDSVVFVSGSVAPHLIAEITKIASSGVEITGDLTDFLPKSNQAEEKSTTVASLRFDSVVAALCNLSRGKAVATIESGYAFINGLEVFKTTKEIVTGDIITVRHYGRFEIFECENLTRKGRTVLKYKHFK
jgi:RNA-binding protein YlmH